MLNCHICGGYLDEFESFSDLHQVTSDCRPWRKGGHLCICQKCYTVQKPITRQWQREVEEIYNGYEMYTQGSGLEQNTFDSLSGASEARSIKIVSWLESFDLPETGSLLDIGCGNGAFLKAFSKKYPKWDLTGLELDNRNKEEIESINGVKKLYTGNVNILNEHFDIIVMIHVLEHISNPVQYLIALSKKLKQGGSIIIEVPHLAKSPFDILIADHCIHFDFTSLETVVKRSGFKVVKAVSDYIPKEISLLGQWLGEEKGQIIEQNVTYGNNLNNFKSIVDENINWLLKFAYEGLNQSDSLGIFGTSISATWLLLP